MLVHIVVHAVCFYKHNHVILIPHCCLLMQPSEDLYDQKPAEIVSEPVIPAPTPGGTGQSAPRTSRFVYSDDSLSTSESNGNRTSKTGHVTKPSAVADFFTEFGATPIRTSYSNGRSKAQVCLIS